MKHPLALSILESVRPGCVAEYRFNPERRWRFDFAWPDIKVAVEIDGGVWRNGRHTRGSGFVKDMEKLNAAAANGWAVFRFTPQDITGRMAQDVSYAIHLLEH